MVSAEKGEGPVWMAPGDGRVGGAELGREEEGREEEVEAEKRSVMQDWMWASRSSVPGGSSVPQTGHSSSSRISLRCLDGAGAEGAVGIGGRECCGVGGRGAWVPLLWL